ncbi:MAG: Sapep family Mn(2+)-dependent dipeptidase [Synergistaceae bacterium]|jgi:succinyl-diaminopimelate desuccinylase|nr:Sapep family Mn(2+)-dependent dipeptidase [Synergistaceae bacterium]
MGKTQLLQEIDSFIEENENDILSDMAELVSKRSVRGPAEDGAPFGPGPRSALDAGLAIAKRLGLLVNDGDGYVGWADIPGKGKEYIGVIAHLDVVPEGDGWNSDPYVLTERDGWLIGRGISDNKGAAVVSLYAAAFLARAGKPLNYGIRVMMGCDEECGMHDVTYYLSRNPEPIFCFTPDVDFPVSIGEKGIHSGGVFVSAPVFTTISSFSAGIATNAIPGRASCVLSAPGMSGKKFKETEGIAVLPRDDGSFLIEARGIGGHAAHPDGKVNAIGILTDFLLDNEIGGADERLFLELLRKIHSNAYGEGLGIACTGESLGRLTSIGGVISQEGGVLRQDMNIRYPECVTGGDITKALSKIAAEHNARFEEGEITEPFYISPDFPAIKVLLSAYREISGHAAEPYTMFGGTYARHFKNAVGFGPGDDFTPRPSFVASDHAPNEASYFPSLKEALKIFILALWRLQELSPEELGR